MSTWKEAEDEDISIDRKSNEVNIYVTQNNWGSIYVTLTFKQIEELYDKILKVK